MAANLPDLWHGMTVEAAARELSTNTSAGLSPTEAERRLDQYGPNAIREAPPTPAWRLFLAQFADFMIVVLLVAGVIAGALGEPEDTIAIFAIVLLNAVIGFVQEFRAEKAMALLRKMAEQQARVIREGRAQTIPASQLVPGDLVLLEAGNSVPADLRLVEVAQLQVEEAALTGESQPIEKTSEPVDQDPNLPLGDRWSMAFKGTIVTRGRGRGLVVRTGMNTELGKIAEMIGQPVENKTPLQRRLAHFGRYLAIGALVICGIIFVAGLQRGEPVVTMFLTSVSLAVAAIPEALPAVVTITLALGARRMLRAKALVRHLPAVETLGSVTYICSDKTGTLTENRMRVSQILCEEEVRPLLLTAMALNNDADWDSDGGTTGDPTEVALLEAAQRAGHVKGDLEREMPRVGEHPFDSARRRMTTLHRNHREDAGRIVFTKGAPETVLDLCSRELRDGQEEPFDRSSAEETAERMAQDGLRVLAFAYRTATPQEAHKPAEVIESGLTYLGLAGLIDPPRDEARGAVETCKEAGIVPVMITGDHPSTAAAIARALGISSGGDPVMTGPELAGVEPAELREKVRQVRVYARVNPLQKLRIVEALQANHEFVAMTGDGINDAPALKRADIGVAMGEGGTDVAREAAKLVLLDDNFATIVAATREGRHIFDNIRKFVKFILASNAAEILTIFVAPFLGLPVPLLPIHILWINLVTDGLPGLALAVEPEEGNVMTRPPRPPTESLFARGLWQHVIWVGTLIAVLTIFSQAWLYRTGSGHWQTMVFTVLTIAQMANVLAERSERESTFRLGFFSNRPLAGAVLLTIGLQMAAIYFPPMQQLFRTAPLSAQELAIAFGLSSVVFFAVEIEKWMVRRGWLYQQRAS